MSVKHTKPEENGSPKVEILDLTLVAPDRSRKDIKTLKDAVQSGEAIHHPNRVILYDLYHDILSMDGYLRGIIGKRIYSVLNKKLVFKNAKGERDQDVTDMMRSLVGRNLVKLIMESELWGISGVEFIVGPKIAFREIPRKHIKPEKGLITKSQYSTSVSDGFCYDEMPFVWVIGEPRNLGLLLGCSMYAIYKRGNFGDWAQYVEIFGQPVRIIYYDAYDTATKNELRKVLDESGSALAMMLPKQAELQLLDGKTSNGNGELQQRLKDACNSEMAVCILGNTETTSSSASSGYAQSKEHGEQQDEITASDLILVENYLNSEKFLAVLKTYGYKVEGGKFEYELELNLAKLKTRLEIDRELVKIVPVEDDYFYETYGIPKPKAYDKLKAKMEERQIAWENAKKEVEADKANKDKGNKSDLIDTAAISRMERFLALVADFFDPARH